MCIIQYTEKRDNSTFWNVFAGHYFQCMSEKAGQLASMPKMASHLIAITVEPVYNGHPRDWTKLAVIYR